MGLHEKLTKAGIYHECSTMSKTPTDVEMYCKACGKGLMAVKAGGAIFTDASWSKCSCSWGCCEASKPAVHEQHLGYR